jgi:hypothetical protein
MGESLEQGNLSDRSRWQSFIFVVEPNLLYGYNVVGQFIASLIDYPIRALSDFIDALVTFDLG